MLEEQIEKLLRKKLDKKKQEVTKLKWEKVRLEETLRDLEKKEAMKKGDK